MLWWYAALLCHALAYHADDRLLIVTWAPPASGKTAAMNLFLNDHSIKDWVDVRVDDLMLTIPQYRRASLLLKQIVLKAPVKRSPGIQHLLCKLSGALYFHHRPWGERHGNALLLGQLIRPKGERQHAIFELTGSDGAMFWLDRLSRLFRDEGYRVHLVIPVAADSTQLQERAWRRLMDPKERDFRLPCPETICKLAQEAERNSLNLLQRHLHPDTPSAFPVDGITIVDTSMGPVRMAYEVIHGRVVKKDVKVLHQLPSLRPYAEVVGE